jgi:hypothetical protein
MYGREVNAIRINQANRRLRYIVRVQTILADAKVTQETIDKLKTQLGRRFGESGRDEFVFVEFCDYGDGSVRIGNGRHGGYVSIPNESAVAMAEWILEMLRDEK